MFNIEDIRNLNPIKCEDRYVFNGRNVPRVTEIISKMIHEDYLMHWSNALGFKKQKYKEVLDFAADYGSRTHYGIECYLKQLPISPDTPVIPMNTFIKWWKDINTNNKVEIVGQEQKLICEWYGGTYDLLLKINDRIFLTDFKTSNHVSYKYILQLAAYNRILKSMGILISGIIILKLSKQREIYKEYVLDLSIQDQQSYFDTCERTFMSLLYSYYHIHYLEGEFKNEIINSSK